MTFLRTVSTRRLLALIAALIAAVGGGTAIAVAASSGGPVPPRKPLASAIHAALAAPEVNGISARISFTNHLIDSSNIEGADPILKGATGRLWLTMGQNSHRLRLELQGDNGDAQAVFDNGSFWVYDPSSNTVYRGKLPQDHTTKAPKAKHETVPSVTQIQSDLNRAMQHTNLSGALPGDVAGQPAYSVRVSPKHDGGLLGAASLAWDAVRGLPLRFGIYARGSSSPVLELSVTDISYGAVPASDFTVSPPSNAKVVNVSVPAGHAATRAHARRLSAAKRAAQVAGVTAVAKRLQFKLLAPGKLVGLPRQSVRLLDWSGKPAALVTYGENLGGVAVIEQPAASTTTSTGSSGKDHRGLNLPTVSINGATGQELDTALGTVVRFTRAGVTYTVLGSVPPAAAEAAARQL